MHKYQFLVWEFSIFIRDREFFSTFYQCLFLGEVIPRG